MNEAHRLEQVAQEDREAAASFGLYMGKLSDLDVRYIKEGAWDETEYVLAFARHRRAAISAYEATRQGEVEGRIAERRRHDVGANG